MPGGFKNNKKTIIILSLIVIVCTLFISDKIFQFDERRINGAHTILLLIGSLAATPLFIILIVSFLGTLKKKFGIYDFFIGDEGTYSLSRLQAVLWAIVIISYQISVIGAILVNKNATLFNYQASFSESSVWLLSLSLSSYIMVKGIMVDKISKNPMIKNRRSKNPQWCDILIGDNGLDFAKCQMLIWTVIAIFAYLVSCYYFINHLLIDTPEKINEMFKHFYEDYSSSEIAKKPELPFVPYLPWTFVVLMGISQGAYVGKKLVPTFKIDEAKEGASAGAKDNIARIDIEIATKQAILNNMKPITTVGILNRQQLQLEMQDLLSQRDREQHSINKLQN